MGSPQNNLSVPQQNTPSWMGGSPSGSQGFGNQQMSPNQQFQGLLAAGQGLQNNTQGAYYWFSIVLQPLILVK